MKVNRLFVQLFLVFLMVSFIFGGLGTKSFAVEKEPIKIGIVGPFKWIQGVDMEQASNLAVEEINASGGVLGRKLTLIKGETEADSAKGKAAVERLLFNDNVDFIVGVFRSDVGIIVQPIIMDQKKIWITSAASVPSLADNVVKDYGRFKYFFRVSPDTKQLAPAFTDQLKDLVGMFGFNKVAIVAEDVVWTEEIVESVKSAFGNQVVLIERPSTKSLDYSSELIKVKRAGAQVIFALFSANQTIPFVNQWHDLKIPAIITGMPVSAQDNRFWQQTNGRAQAVLTWKHGVRAPITKLTIPYWDKYTQKYGGPPVSITNFGTYDAIYILKAAIEKAGTLNSDVLVKNIEDMTITGVSGAIKFDERHATKVGKVYLPFTYVQWQDGEQFPVWPKEIGVKNIVLPAWMK